MLMLMMGVRVSIFAFSLSVCRLSTVYPRNFSPSGLCVSAVRLSGTIVKDFVAISPAPVEILPFFLLTGTVYLC